MLFYCMKDYRDVADDEFHRVVLLLLDKLSADFPAVHFYRVTEDMREHMENALLPTFPLAVDRWIISTGGKIITGIDILGPKLREVLKTMTSAEGP